MDEKNILFEFFQEAKKDRSILTTIENIAASLDQFCLAVHIKELKKGMAPPIGLKPEWLWKEERRKEIVGAISRYLESGMKVPDEWINEYNKLLS